MSALGDVALLTTWAVAGVLFVLAWLGLGLLVALAVGRAVRGRDRQVPVEPTREMPVYRMPPTDTVELPAFDPMQGQLGNLARTRR